MAQEPAAGEAGDGGEGRRGEAHHRVRDRHVAHKQVHPRVQARCPGHTHTYRPTAQTRSRKSKKIPDDCDQDEEVSKGSNARNDSVQD